MGLRSPKRVIPVIACASAVLATLVIAGHATAAGPRPESAVRAEAIRSDYIEIMAALGEIGRARRLADVQWASARGQEVIITLSNEELLAFGDVMPDLEVLRTQVQRAAADMLSREVHWPDDGTSEARTPGSFPTAGYSSECPSPRPDTGDAQAVMFIVQAAKAVWAAADRACEQLVVGFNVSLACIPADLLIYAEIAILEHVFFCADDINSAEILANFQRAAHIHDDMTDAQEDDFVEADNATSLRHNKDLIVAARDLIIATIQHGKMKMLDAIAAMDLKMQELIRAEFKAQNAQLEAFREYSLRTWIEADLGSEDDRVASFQLPPIFGGRLGLVSDVVHDTIDNMTAAAQGKQNAIDLVDQADKEVLFGNYKLAYDLYAQAYRQATLIKE